MTDHFFHYAKNGKLFPVSSPLKLKHECIVFDDLKIPIDKVCEIIIGKHKDSPEAAANEKVHFLLSIVAKKGVFGQKKQYHFLQKADIHPTIYVFVNKLGFKLEKMGKHKLSLSNNELYDAMKQMEEGKRKSIKITKVALTKEDKMRSSVDPSTKDHYFMYEKDSNDEYKLSHKSAAFIVANGCLHYKSIRIPITHISKIVIGKQKTTQNADENTNNCLLLTIYADEHYHFKQRNAMDEPINRLFRNMNKEVECMEHFDQIFFLNERQLADYNMMKSYQLEIALTIIPQTMEHAQSDNSYYQSVQEKGTDALFNFDKIPIEESETKNSDAQDIDKITKDSENVSNESKQLKRQENDDEMRKDNESSAIEIETNDEKALNLQEMNKLRLQYDELAKMYNNKLNLLNETTKKNDLLQSQYDELQKRFNDREGALNELSAENEEYQKRIYEFERNEREHNNLFKALENECNKMKIQIKENEIEQQRDTILLQNKMDLIYEQTSNNVHSMQSEHKKEVNRIKMTLEKRYNEKVKALHALRAKLNEYKRESENRRQTIHQLRDDAVLQSERDSDEHKKAMNELSNKTKSYNALKRKSHNLMNEKNEIEAKFGEISQKYENLKNDLIKETEFGMSKMKSKMNKMRKSLHEKNEIIQEYEESESKKSKQLSKEYDNLMNEKDEIKEKYDEIRQKYEELEAKQMKYEKSSKKQDTGNNEMIEISQKCQNLQKKLLESEKNQNKILTKYKDLLRKFGEMKNNVIFDNLMQTATSTSSVSSEDLKKYSKAMNNMFGCQAAEKDLVYLDENVTSMTDMITIIGRDRVYIQMKIIANREFVEIGSERFVYRDIWKIIQCSDSGTKWVILTKYGMVMMMASSRKMRAKFIGFIQAICDTVEVCVSYDFS